MPQHFGKRVIGAAAAAAEAAKASKGAHVFGPRVVGATPAASDGTGDQKPPTDSGAAQGLSIAKMEALLTENPALLDSLVADEETRVEGPRKGALRLFARVEAEQAEPRAALLEHLSTLLEQGAR